MNSRGGHSFVYFRCSEEKWRQRKGLVVPKGWALWKRCWYFSSWPWLGSASPLLCYTSWTNRPAMTNLPLFQVSVCSVKLHWSSAQKNTTERCVCFPSAGKWSNTIFLFIRGVSPLIAAFKYQVAKGLHKISQSIDHPWTHFRLISTAHVLSSDYWILKLDCILAFQHISTHSTFQQDAYVFW